MDVVNLLADGPISYSDGLELQKSVHSEVASGKRPNTILLLEHISVYTGGKMSELSDIADPDIEVVETDRGGKITWHGPGQLIGYPIYRLPRPIDVVEYVRSLENLIIESIAAFGVIGKHVEKRTGVWVGADGAEEKIAAIGIRIAERTAMHGFAVNVNNSLDPFRGIIACGIKDAGITTLQRESKKSVNVAEVAQRVEENMRRFLS